MATEQGITTAIAFKAQVSKGTAASGSGGQLLRRETAMFEIAKDTYSNNEIVSHQQHTGDKHGIARTNGTLNGLLSCSSYEAFTAALLRKAWAATSAISSLSLTIAASGSGYTVTRGTGDFLTGGIKIGDGIRLSGGSLNSANVGVNLLVTGVTQTVLTVIVPSGLSLTAEGPISSCTVTVVGKKSWVPTSGHTNIYYTIEEAFGTISRYRVYPDVQVGSLALNMPATGNVGAVFNFLGLGAMTPSGSQSLTSPTAETTTDVMASVSGAVVVGGVQQAIITSASITIDGGIGAGEAVIGANTIPDTQKSRIKVTGTITYLYESETLSAPFYDEDTTSIVLMLEADRTGSSDFITIALPEVKLFSDTRDDGEKQIVRTSNFTAEICSSGGEALANNQTICQIQDSTL
ncbi:MAG: hypothetical protein J7496_08555 [Novosphingobium sp.]|nr:hypothetical protein [Novosphingobium sp.]